MRYLAGATLVTLAVFVPGLQLTGAQGAARRTARPALQPPAPAPAFLAQYCVTCHNARVKSGGLALDSLDRANVIGHAESWEKVVRSEERRVGIEGWRTV